MKVQFELNLDSNGRPCIKFRHHDKDNSLKQKALKVFLDAVKEKGCELRNISGYLERGTSNSCVNKEINLINKQMEKLIKQKLIERGFFTKTLLNNRGLIGAVIDETKEAINVTRCYTELPMIEELIISEIKRKHQKQVDNEVERFLSGNGTDCRLRGFFSETDYNE